LRVVGSVHRSVTYRRRRPRGREPHAVSKGIECGGDPAAFGLSDWIRHPPTPRHVRTTHRECARFTSCPARRGRHRRRTALPGLAPTRGRRSRAGLAGLTRARLQGDDDIPHPDVNRKRRCVAGRGCPNRRGTRRHGRGTATPSRDGRLAVDLFRVAAGLPDPVHRDLGRHVECNSTIPGSVDRVQLDYFGDDGAESTRPSGAVD
jgi:hypothetical protein